MKPIRLIYKHGQCKTKKEILNDISHSLFNITKRHHNIAYVGEDFEIVIRPIKKQKSFTNIKQFKKHFFPKDEEHENNMKFLKAVAKNPY